MRFVLSVFLGTFALLSFGKTRKVEFKTDIIPLAAFVGQNMNVDLPTLLKGPGSGPLVWSTGTDKPAWVNLNSAGGKLTGTPAASDLGTKSFRLSVQDGDSGALARVDLTVYPPPKWKKNPLDLGVQKEDNAWSLDIAQFVDNPGGGKLTFSVDPVASLPSWMKLDAAGILSGTPKRKDVGKYTTVGLVVTSALGGTDKTLGFGEVLINIKAPKWTQNPIIASNAIEDFPYSFDLSIPDFVSNPEAAPLTFTLKQGAASGWVQMTSSGTLFGTPKKNDLGTVTLRAVLTANINGTVYTDETDVVVQVVHTNHPPEWKLNPIVLADAPVKIPYLADIAQYAFDQDGDPITIKIVSGPAWAKISSAGTIGGTPLNGDFGLNEWTVEVADAEFSIPTQVRVKVINKPPYWITKPTVLPNAKEDSLYTVNLIPFVKDPDNDPVSFTLVSGPSWAKVNITGAITGTPNGDNVGLNKFVIRVTDNVSGVDETEVQINVEHVNHNPYWTQNPIVLPNAKEKLAYNQSISAFAADKDKNDTLTITKLSGPAWVAISAGGQITGTPGRTDVGLATVQVRVADQTGASADSVVQITVEKTNRPPVWTQDPIDLGETLEGTPLNVDVAKFAIDQDGDPLTFKKVNGPAWVTVSTDGKAGGTPARPDAGAYTVTFEVSDGEYTAQAKGTGTVKAKTLPPVIHADQLTFTVKERQTLVTNLNQPKFVEDPQGLPLAFTLVDTDSWLTLTPNGELTLKPLHGQIGNHQFRVQVTNGKLTADGLVKVVVIADPRPPIWLIDPVTFTTLARVPFQRTLADQVKDPDGLPLTFVKKSGPAWLTVDANGKISGTPQDGDVGDNKFVITVKNASFGTDGNVIITVTPNNHPPYWTQDPVQLANGIGGTPYSKDVSSYAKDPDPTDVLTFSKVSGPNWLNVSSGGTLSGTPAKTDVGVVTLKVRVTDPSNAFADTTVTFTLDKYNAAPVWLQEPIDLGTTIEDSTLNFDLTKFAFDGDGDPLTFKKISGPNWFSVSAAGIVNGIPKEADIGNINAVFEVTDGKLSAQVKAIGKVIGKNHPPIIHADQLAFTVKERSTLTVLINDKKYVEDQDNNSLSFQLLTPVEWVSLSSDGNLVLKPLHQHIGTQNLNFRVSDGTLTVDGVIKVTVVRDPRPPVWLEDPVRFDAVSRTPFNATVAGKAKDLDGLPITFVKKAGPAWLNVAADGGLSGTPVDGDVGENTFILTAKNDLLGTDGTVIVKVTMGNHPPIVHDEQLVFTVKERQTFSISIADKKYIEDVDGDALIFSWLQTASWADLSSSGQLTLKPGHDAIGNHSFPFKVTDGKLTAQGTINVRVLRDPRPPVWLEDPIRFTAKTGRPFTGAIADKVKELDNMPLSFTKKSGPAWLVVDPQGNLSGTPPENAVGENKFIITASNDGASSDGNVIVTVVLGNNPPVWMQDPIALGSVEVGKLFQKSVASFAYDKDNDPLTFEKISGPGWLFVSTDGTVTGTPASNDAGVAAMVVRVSDPLKASADATVNISVTVKPNQPPIWLQDPINLGDLTADALFAKDLAPLVKDPDGDGLTFRKVSGPQWLTLASNGQLQARPAKTDVGAFTATFEVSDGKVAVTANAFGKVISGQNQPPIVKPEAMSFVVKEGTTFNVNLNQPQYVVDPDGDPLTFVLNQQSDWVTLASSGALVLKPQHKDLGDHTFSLTISDNKGNSVPATMFVRVLPDAKPPIWLQDPIRMEATVGVPFNNTLFGKAQDPNGLALTFSKVNGPTWLNVAGSGALSGTPAQANLGDNTFRVSVTNGSLSAEATLIVTVKSGGPQVDVVQVDKAVPGAPSENVWVLDNSWPWLEQNRMMKQMKEDIHVYFEALNAAQVRSTGLYLSSDVARWKGIPNQGDDTSLFIQGNDSQVASHFISRIDETYNKKCYTSPIWGLHKFYEFVPTNSEIMNRFFNAGVPMDVMIATPHVDHYQTFSKGTPQAKDTPSDFAQRFIAFHQKEQQNYRISTIAPDCTVMQDPMGTPGNVQSAKDNPFRTLTQMTKGVYYKWDCHFDMEKTLKDYASQVIFRAYVSAKRQILLSKKPLDPAAIQVSIGGVPLASDKWSYDASKQAVNIFWEKIDLSTIKPGDMIEIRYNVR